MIKVSEVVREILSEDSFIIEALQRGLMNLNFYAKQIQPLVENKARKPVALGTIVVSLARLKKEIQNQHLFNPKVHIKDLSVKSSLCEITYSKTDDVLEKVSALTGVLIDKYDFFTVTQGLHEVTIVCSEDIKEEIIKHFKLQPKVVIDQLVAVTVNFSDEYMVVPNTIYSLVGILATKQINLIEIVSTYTELSFVVYKNELEKTIGALNNYSEN